MRVGLVVEPSQPQAGGAHTFEHDVLQAFFQLRTESRHEFVLLAPGSIAAPADLPFVTLGYGIPERAISRLGRATRLLTRSIMGGGELGTDPRIERVLLRSGVEMLWYLTPYAPTFSIPFITVVWDLQHRLQPYFPEVSAGGEWSKRERHYAEKLQRAAVIIAGTEAGKSEIVRFYGVPEWRVHILPHPTPAFALDAQAEAPEPTLKRYGLTKGYLFYPAQFWPHKNHVGLLLALKALRDEHGLEPPLVLVGSERGTQAAIAALAKRLGLSATVRILGFVPQEDLPALYRGASALTYLSFFGPENLPPLEAFALGCPVVASDVSGAREQLGDAALLVDGTQPDEVARAIRSVLSDAALRGQLVRRGAARARQWTGTSYVRAVLDILDRHEPIVRCWRRQARRD